MTEIKFTKPDYKFWVKKEGWSLHQSALLLHGIDPLEVRSVRLTAKDLAPEFKKAQKTYLLLQSVPWSERHPGYFSYGIGAHPVAIIVEAKKKGLPIPVRLLNLVKKRFEKEQEEKKEDEEAEKDQNTQTPIKQTAPDQPLSSRERKNLLKAIGILVKLLGEKREKTSGIKLSALQVSQLMLDKAHALGIEIEGLKSFDRKITEALALLDEEVA